jgi:agmatine deiminase
MSASDPTRTTPRAAGFRMPAEWEPHSGCYLVWPERPDNWRLGAKPAQAAWIAVVEAIAAGDPVTVLTSYGQWPNARARLPKSVRLVETSTNDSWVRDTGPAFLVDDRGALAAVDWAFNAWGGLVSGLFFPWDADDIAGSKIAELERVPYWTSDVVLEGGSIDVDGQGTLLTTEECLLNPNRNPELSRADLEGVLSDYLAVDKVIWLPLGVVEDETDGHVDNFARFVAPGVVVLTWTDDRSDPQYARSAAALEVLEKSADARGRSFEVVKLHQPGPLFAAAEEAETLDLVEGSRPRLAGDRLAGSYVNCYLGNGIVVVPTFDDPHDEAAVQAYEKLFPDREVLQVPGREILLGGGNVHCITQPTYGSSARTA